MASLNMEKFKVWAAKIGQWCIPVGLLAFVGGALVAVFNLGLVFKLGWDYSALVAAGAIALVLGHAFRVITASANIERLLHGLSLLTWIVMILFFSVLYFAMMGLGVTPAMSETDITLKLSDSFLQADILDSGRTLYSYAVAVGLVTALVTSVVTYAMANPLINDRVHKTLGEGFAPMALNLVTGLVVLTSALHVLQFGTEFAGVSVVESIVACAVAELTFVAAEQMCVKELKARATTEKLDVFDLVAWGLLALIALAYMVAINHVYGVMAAQMAAHPADKAAGMLAAQAATADGFMGFSKDLYAISAPVFGGLLIVLKILTTAVNVTTVRRAAGLTGQPIAKPVKGHVMSKTTPPLAPFLRRKKRDALTPPAGAPDQDQTADQVPDPTADALQQNDADSPDMDDLRSIPRQAGRKTCSECGKSYKSQRADSRFCSDACRKKASRRRVD